MKKEATQKHTGLKTKDLRWKQRQLQNARGSKQNTSDEKIGNPKMQGAQNKKPPMKKEKTSKHKGSKQKTCDEKRGNPKTQGFQTEDLRWKWGNPQHARKPKIRNR
jgi:hypothetical protein